MLMMRKYCEFHAVASCGRLTRWRKTSYYHAPFAPDEAQKNVYESHIIAYSEVLHQWDLTEKRAELLKHLGHSLSPEKSAAIQKLNGIDADTQISEPYSWLCTLDYADQGCFTVLGEFCERCGAELMDGPKVPCTQCAHTRPRLGCTVCRLPVNGASMLYRSCRLD